MLGDKSYIGLKIVGEDIKLLRMVPNGKKFTVDAMGSINITELIKGPRDSDPFASDEDEGDTDSGDVFGFDDTKPEKNKSVGGKSMEQESLTLEDELKSDLEDDAWLSEEDSESKNLDVKSRIVYELQEVLFELAGKRVELAIVIPAGRTAFYNVEKTPDLKGKKKIDKLVREQLEESYAISDLSEDQYRWMEKGDREILAAVYQDKSILFDLFESLNIANPHTYFLRSFIPEELILMQFLDEPEPVKKPKKKKGEPESEEDKGSTVLINLGKQGARIVFVQDGMIQSAMPLISMKRPGPAFVNKVFSRIIMELEKGQVAFIRKFQIHDEVGAGDSLADVLSTNFEGIQAELILPDELVSIDPSLDKSWNDIDLSILGGTIFASGRRTRLSEEFSFIPKRIHDRQKPFKLKWYGILILLLILIAPIALNNWYQDVSAENEELQFAIDLQTQQINDLQQIKASLDILDAQIAELSADLELIGGLSERSMLWTVTLDILNAGMPDIGSAWISSLQFTSDRLMIEGTTMFRDRIPRIAELFESAGIQQVSRVEFREREFFNFVIAVDRITANDQEFDPEYRMNLENGGGDQ